MTPNVPIMKIHNPVYVSLSRLKIVSGSYPLKFLFIAFLGIHIPLIGIILYLLFGPARLEPLPVFLLALVLTLLATAGTLYLLNGLLYPLKQSKKALEEYLDKKVLPGLPVHYKDEAGILMQKVQITIMALNTMLEEKRDLASLLSHDLKQPLAVIGTASEAIQNTTDTAATQKLAGTINRMVKEQFTLLEDVLQLLKYDVLASSGDQLTVVPVESLVDDLMETSQVQAGTKNITIETDMQFDGLISVNLELFRQVLKNILHNAVKFSHPGGRIGLQVRQQGDRILFSIKDQGLGFDPRIAPALFQPFTRQGQTGTNGEPSTGVGLHLCKKIIDLHGGRIEAYSAGAGTGATFTIELPYEEEMEEIVSAA